MRKIIVLSFVSLDGVMQAPGGPDEDRSGGFKYGGWTVPYFDAFLGNEMVAQLSGRFDLLLGRVSYDIFASYWPQQDTKNNPIAAAINTAKKYVVSHQPKQFAWSNSVSVHGDVVAQLKNLKADKGPELQVHGSGDLIQTLLKNDLVDEFWLKIYPVVLGSGKHLFGEGAMPAAFAMRESKTSPLGVLIASYARDGDVKTGSFVD